MFGRLLQSILLIHCASCLLSCSLLCKFFDFRVVMLNLTKRLSLQCWFKNTNGLLNRFETSVLVICWCADARYTHWNVATDSASCHFKHKQWRPVSAHIATFNGIPVHVYICVTFTGTNASSTPMHTRSAPKEVRLLVMCYSVGITCWLTSLAMTFYQPRYISHTSSDWCVIPQWKWRHWALLCCSWWKDTSEAFKTSSVNFHY